jgi:hypothetical protein
MNAFDALWHILHFTAPALAVAALLSLRGPFWGSKWRFSGFLWRFVLNTLAALLALSLGLWFLGNDGKMLSYVAMVLACASSQWCLMRSWRA